MKTKHESDFSTRTKEILTNNSLKDSSPIVEESYYSIEDIHKSLYDMNIFYKLSNYNHTDILSEGNIKHKNYKKISSEKLKSIRKGTFLIRALICLENGSILFSYVLISKYKGSLSVHRILLLADDAIVDISDNKKLEKLGFYKNQLSVAALFSPIFNYSKTGEYKSQIKLSGISLIDSTPFHVYYKDKTAIFDNNESKLPKIFDLSKILNIQYASKFNRKASPKTTLVITEVNESENSIPFQNSYSRYSFFLAFFANGNSTFGITETFVGLQVPLRNRYLFCDGKMKSIANDVELNMEARNLVQQELFPIRIKELTGIIYSGSSFKLVFQKAYKYKNKVYMNQKCLLKLLSEN